MRTFYTKDGKNIVNRLSRWIKIKYAYNVNRRNSLFEFATCSLICSRTSYRSESEYP